MSSFVLLQMSACECLSNFRDYIHVCIVSLCRHSYSPGMPVKRTPFACSIRAMGPTDCTFVVLAGQSVDEVDEATFHKALYTICIGGNDIIQNIFDGKSPKAIIRDLVSDVVNRIVGAVKVS